MPNKKNVESVELLTKKFTSAQAVALADYRGLTAEETESLRSKARAAGVELRVGKNRLMKLALKNANADAMDKVLKGPTMVAFAPKDAVSMAKMVTEFAKTNEKFKVKAGLLTGRSIDSAQLTALASLPSREAMLSRLAGGLISPVQKFAYALEATRSKVVHAIDAVRRSKEGGAA